MLDQAGQIKLTDFELPHLLTPLHLSRTEEKSETEPRPDSPPQQLLERQYNWTAPEKLAILQLQARGERSPGYDLEKADVWSFGCCVVEMLTGKSLEISFSSTQEEILNVVQEVLQQCHQISETWGDLILSCLAMDPESRFSISKLRDH